MFLGKHLKEVDKDLLESVLNLAAIDPREALKAFDLLQCISIRSDKPKSNVERQQPLRIVRNWLILKPSFVGIWGVLINGFHFILLVKPALELISAHVTVDNNWPSL